jgi:hypothetical protein
MITIVDADERINAELKSLSILCVGDRGQPILAYGAKKFDIEKKVGLLRYIPSTK